MANHRVIGVFAVLFLLRLVCFSPSELEFAQNKDDVFDSYYNERAIRNRRGDHVSTHVSMPHKEGVAKLYAPLIIGAGQGTTGTHLFVDATCALGFVSLHYGIGCLPKHVLNMSEIESVHLIPDTKTKISLQLLPAHQHYRELLQRHSRITSGLLKAFKNNETDPVDYRDKLLHELDSIIKWGKQHKVGIALHDTPYPMLMPEIFKLVRKHYNGKAVEPIILLSERDPEEYTERRIQSHGSYSWICRPRDRSITIQKINHTTYHGGAFDFTGCINAAAPNLTMNEIFITMHQASKGNQRQFIVDSFTDYQETMGNAALFTYNIFGRKNKTSISDLRTMIRQSFEMSLFDDNRQLRMKEGSDFYGFQQLHLNENMADKQSSKALVDILVFKNQVLL